MASADLVVTLDAATPKRCNLEGGWDAIADKPVANIDHHITNSDYGRVNWVVDNASSTCELVHRLIVQAGWSLDASTATLLYAGIYADTAAFSLPNVRPETFDAAAELLRHGADIETVGARITRSHEPHEFDLVRRVYHNTHVACGGRIAYSSVSCQELHEIGCTPADIDDQVSIPRSLSGIRIAILFSEGEPGVIRINLRGENGTPVLNLAESLGGGGHLCSAGVRMRGELGEVIARVVSEAGEYLGRLDSTR
jgi:phosphoesterase RecJ-like protein